MCFRERPALASALWLPSAETLSFRWPDCILQKQGWVNHWKQMFLRLQELVMLLCTRHLKTVSMCRCEPASAAGPWHRSDEPVTRLCEARHRLSQGPGPFSLTKYSMRGGKERGGGFAVWECKERHRSVLGEHLSFFIVIEDDIRFAILAVFKDPIQWREVYSQRCAAMATIHLHPSRMARSRSLSWQTPGCQVEMVP